MLHFFNLWYLQVVTGGHYDIDMTLKSPKDEVLFQAVQKQYDSHTFNAGMEGTYSACFSNEFSTFSHKLVYVDWQVNNEEPLPGMEANPTAMTQVFIECHSIYRSWYKATKGYCIGKHSLSVHPHLRILLPPI